MRRLGVSRPTVAGWLTRFEQSGVSGLVPRPRSGRPPKLTASVLRHLATAAGSRPRELGMDGVAWTLPTLRAYLVKARAVSTISLESIRVALRKAGLSLKTARTRLIQKGTTTMIPAAFEYHAPSTVGEATALLARLGEDAKILSGGQSLIPLMKLRLANPLHLVDINGIAGLAYIREADGVLRIGGLTRESELEESELVRTRYPLLHDTSRVIADPVVRNLATAAVAAQLTLGANGVCDQVGIGLTNVGLTPIKAARAEAALKGKTPDEATIKRAAELAAEASEPAADLRGSVEYKKDLVRVLTARALRKALERARAGR